MARWLVCAGFAIVVTLAILQFSFRHGRLILYITYDDIGYFRDGMHRLQTFYDYGMGGAISEYRTNPPHAPYSSLMAFIGFALFGFHDWAPYVMNVFLAFGYFLLADQLLRGVRMWQKVVCYVFIASLPFVGMAVHEFRPDHAVALFTAAGAFLLLTAPFVHGSRRRQIGAGVLFGVAMLTKPPVFPQTLAIGGASLVLATLSDWLITRRTPSFKAIARAWGFVLLPFILIPLPHYLHNYQAIWAYIQDILFGANRESYINKGDLIEHLLYYLTRLGGKVMLGKDVFLFAPLLVLSGIAVLALRRRADSVHAIALGAMLLMSWLIATLNKTKQPFFGLTFDTLLAFIVVYFLGRIMIAERQRGGWAAWGWARGGTVMLGASTIVALYLFQWPTRVGNYYTGWQQNRREIVEGIFNTIVSHCTFGGADVAPAPDPNVPDQDKIRTPTPNVLFCEIGDVNDQLMSYMALKRQVVIHFFVNDHARSIQEVEKQFDDADFVVAAESGTTLVADFLKFDNWQDQLLADLRARHDFRQIGKFTFRKFGKSLFLFQRDEFRGFTPGAGLGKIEGPFPQEHQIAVRWGYGPRSILKVHADQTGTYDLWWKARTYFPDERVTIKVDGKEAASRVVPVNRQEFTQETIPLSLSAGDHEIDLDYAHWLQDKTDTRPMAVLFKALQVFPESPGPTTKPGSSK